nr:phosphatase PAP2 family protein [Williamsia sp. CHRR-6]
MSATDRRIFDSVAASSHPVIDVVMLRLTQAATFSRLWMVIAAGMWLFGGPAHRRAAVRGMASVAVSSLVTNQGAKRLRGRRRPDHRDVPVQRKPRRMPTSSSMPSGHSASAAAFAVGVYLEHRPTGRLLAPLAAAVGVSRVATGAHYPSDVVVGGALGGGLAAALSKVVKPKRRRVFEPAPSTIASPVDTDGTGIVAVVNPASGSGTGFRIIEQIRRDLPGVEIVTLDEPGALVATLTEVAQRATVLAVGGGDGSVAAGATVALKTGRPLAVFPGGTFNNFARDIGCATVDDTVEMIRGGHLARVDVGNLNGDRIFINTASIGAYPRFVRQRQKLEHRIGKPLAAAWATLYMLLHDTPVRLSVDGRLMNVTMLFIGTSEYSTAEFTALHRPRLDDGVLDMRILRVDRKFARLRVFGALMANQLDRYGYYHQRVTTGVRIQAIDGPTVVALDGEIGQEYRSAVFTVEPSALTVFGHNGNGDRHR